MYFGYYLLLLLTMQIFALNRIKCSIFVPSFRLQDLVNNIKKRNPDLAATQARIKAATIKVPRVKTLKDPHLRVTSLNNRVRTKSTFSPEWRIEFSQKIPFPGKLSRYAGIAKQQLAFFKSEEITTYNELILQGKRLYFKLHLNYVAQRINRNNRKIVSRFISGALALYKTGKKKQTDVLKAHIEHNILSEELLQLKRDEVKHISMINALLNYPATKTLGIPRVSFHKTSEAFDYEKLVTLALQERPELQGIFALAQEENERAELARLNYFPDFTISSVLKQRSSLKGDSWGIGIGINVPLWFRTKQRRERQEAKARAFAHYHILHAFKANIRSRINEILAGINAEKERIALYESGLIPKTIESLSAYEAEYKSGKGNFLMLLDTRRQLQQFEFSFEQSRVQKEILLAELEMEVGIPIEKILITHGLFVGKGDSDE